MGFNYGQKRGRLQELNVKDDSLIGYSLSTYQTDFAKVDIEDVARQVNRGLDEAARRLKEPI